MIAKLIIFGIFIELLSTQNVNVARNVEWDLFCDFQTPCVGVRESFPFGKQFSMTGQVCQYDHQVMIYFISWHDRSYLEISLTRIPSKKSDIGFSKPWKRRTKQVSTNGKLQTVKNDHVRKSPSSLVVLYKWTSNKKIHCHTWWKDAIISAHCFKITQNVSFQFYNFCVFSRFLSFKNWPIW